MVACPMSVARLLHRAWGSHVFIYLNAEWAEPHGRGSPLRFLDTAVHTFGEKP